MNKAAIFKKISEVTLFIRKLEEAAADLGVSIENDKIYISSLAYKKGLTEALMLLDT